jgi:SAM-dependent methyltransferase
MDGLTNVRLLDLGCGVGRSAFQLAGAGPELVLGADLSFSMIQLAQAALQDDAVVYPRRRLGLVYERCRGETVFPHKDKVDFWVCDALSLPFGAASAGAVVGLNLLDSVQSPLGLIDEAGRVLTLGGEACFATPFDWSGAVTPLTQWIGGHSQRSDYEGSSTRILRTLFPRAVAGQPARLEIAKERDGVVWESRRSDRSVTVYNNYLMSLIKTPADPEPRSGGRT